MKRDLSHEELRNEKIAQLTNKHMARRLGELITGNQESVRTVDEALSHEFCKPEVMEQLIMLAVTEPRQAGEKLNSLIEKVVRTGAEIDAIKEAEQLERERDVQAAEERAEQSAFVRMAMSPQ